MVSMQLIVSDPRSCLDDIIGKKLDDILKWLDALNCAEKQDVTLSLRQPDTCRWLFSTSQYMSWRDGQDSVLWLQGKRNAPRTSTLSLTDKTLTTAGSGKSVLAYVLYVPVSFVPSVLIFHPDRSSSIPWKTRSEMKRFFLSSTAISAISVPRVLQK